MLGARKLFCGVVRFYVPSVLVFFTASYTHAQDIFFDGFESDSQANSQTSLVHWNVTQGNVDVSGPDVNGSVGNFGNPVFSQFVDLDGTGADGALTIPFSDFDDTGYSVLQLHDKKIPNYWSLWSQYCAGVTLWRQQYLWRVG
jgi:hypothetical protein